MVLPVFVERAQEHEPLYGFQRGGVFDLLADFVDGLDFPDDGIPHFVGGFALELLGYEGYREAARHPAAQRLVVGFLRGLGRRNCRGYALVEFVLYEVEEHRAHVGVGEGLVAQAVDYFALLVEDVVELQHPLAAGIVLVFDGLLRALYRAVEKRVVERNPLLEGLVEDFRHRAVAEYAHEVVFKRDEEF